MIKLLLEFLPGIGKWIMSNKSTNVSRLTLLLVCTLCYFHWQDHETLNSIKAALYYKLDIRVPYDGNEQSRRHVESRDIALLGETRVGTKKAD